MPADTGALGATFTPAIADANSAPIVPTAGVESASKGEPVGFWIVLAILVILGLDYLDPQGPVLPGYVRERAKSRRERRTPIGRGAGKGKGSHSGDQRRQGGRFVRKGEPGVKAAESKAAAAREESARYAARREWERKLDYATHESQHAVDRARDQFNIATHEERREYAQADLDRAREAHRAAVDEWKVANPFKGD